MHCALYVHNTSLRISSYTATLYQKVIHHRQQKARHTSPNHVADMQIKLI